MSAGSTSSPSGVRLRDFDSGDVAMVRDLASDPYLPLIGTLPLRADQDEALAWIERQRARRDEGIGYSYCIADATTDRALGTVGLWLGQLVHGRATAGYSVAPSARGRGVAAQALRLVSDFAWRLPELHRIELYIEPTNGPSVRTAVSAGYAYEGLLRSHQMIGDRRRDMALYALLRPHSAGSPGSTGPAGSVATADSVDTG